MITESVMRIADEAGKLPAYAWPGGYPIGYIMQDAGVICSACANGENGSEVRTQDDPQWNIVGWCSPGNTEDYPTDEDGPMLCAHCHAVICEPLS